MQKSVIFHQVEVTAGGSLQVRLRKQIMEGDTELAGEYHRFLLEPDVDLDKAHQTVNAHLVQMGWPPMDAETMLRLRRLAAAEHTPQAIEAHKRAKAREREEIQKVAALPEEPKVGA